MSKKLPTKAERARQRKEAELGAKPPKLAEEGVTP
jgi:hypothetical protein